MDEVPKTGRIPPYFQQPAVLEKLEQRPIERCIRNSQDSSTMSQIACGLVRIHDVVHARVIIDASLARARSAGAAIFVALVTTVFNTLLVGGAASD